LAGSAQSDDEAEYAASRFVPALKTSLTDMAQEGLSFDAYPSVLPMPEATPASGGSSRGGSKSARSGRRGEASSARKTTGASSKWAKSSGGSKSGSGGPVRFMGGRHIVFMIGGMSYAEVRAAEEVSVKESREIIIGSTCFVTPAEYMEDLALLGQDED
jgi:syntaxin-binding protein 1